MHTPQITNEIRELAPVDGWASYEATGRACVVCPCGLNTGFIDKTTAAEVYREHPRTGTDRTRWLTEKPEPIRITVDGGGPVIRELIRRIVKNNSRGAA
ncbi:hypothetical protein ABZX40_17895 [Streptomyces sp. NPDC004610]|uniref:hypothetical protein n=1 Tax=unclassified Streptomyces TaxID=2593676 RepID=UPI0033A90483